MNEALVQRAAQWQRGACLLGLAGCLAWIAGAVVSRHSAFQSYWFAWIFWSGIGFGALSILLTHRLAGGAWGEAVRPAMHAASLTIPLMAALLIPVLFSMSDIFPWAAEHGLPAASPHKRAYLTPHWFIVRALGYFAILGVLAAVLRKRGRTSQQSPVSAGGIIVYAACMLFASTDWIMSLEPRWYSTMLVVIVMAWQFLAALALSIIAVTLAARAGLLVTTKQLHDLGNLLLAFVIFWTYVSFAQFLIIWSGNLPREISWYLSRSAGGWQYIAVALAALQFALPFTFLLFRATKQLPQRLLPVAILVFVASALDVFWLVVPSFRPAGLRVQWTDLAAFVGLGGIWFGAFLFLARRFATPLASGEVRDV